MRVWLTKWWRQVTVGCLVVPAVVLGFSALYEPRTGVFDISAALTALYLTLSMFTLNVVGPDPAPWSLQFARLFAAAASSSALILAFFSLLRGNPDVARARKRRDHVVIVGTGPEALRLANQHADQGDRPVWVGEIDAADIETARGRGVTLPGPASDEMLRQILDGAKSVVITTPSDAEAVRLARQVGRATDKRPDLLLNSAELAAQLMADHAFRPVPRLSVVARAAVARNPPIRGAACPPPIGLASRLTGRLLEPSSDPGRLLCQVLGAGGIEEFAVSLHAAYLVTSEETDNATSSDLAHTQWPELKEEERAANRASARDVAVKIASLGLDWRAAPDHAGPWIPDDSTLTWLGEAEHRRWARHQVAHGRKHRFVEPWAMLDEKTKQYDTDAVLAHFSHLAEIGIEVFDPKEER